jgi:hypothetical protein
MGLPADLLSTIDWSSFLLGATTGGLGVGGLALFRYRRSQTNIGGSQSDQSKANVGGDMAGRDINKSE